MDAPQTARQSRYFDAPGVTVRKLAKIAFIAAVACSLETAVRAADGQPLKSGFVQLSAQQPVIESDGPIATEGNTPAELPAATSSSDTAVHLFHTTVPASKMKVRRDPSPDRYLGGKDARSIRDVADQLKQDEQKNPYEHSGTTRMTDLGWSPDLPYGRYLYIHHAPLLFEDIPAERYGEVDYPYLHPVIGFTKFVSTVPLLPYKVTTNYYAAYHNDAWYAYDHHGNLRPGILEGSFFPSWEVIRTYPEANLAGLAAQGAATAGIFFLLP